MQAWFVPSRRDRAAGSTARLLDQRRYDVGILLYIPKAILQVGGQLSRGRLLRAREALKQAGLLPAQAAQREDEHRGDRQHHEDAER